MQKTKRINFWLNDKDFAKIDRRAKADGLSHSEYIRKLISQAQIIPPPDIDFTSYEEYFRCLGYELNAIVKAYSTFGYLNKTAADSLWNEIMKLTMQLRSELIEKTIDLEVKHLDKQKG